MTVAFTPAQLAHPPTFLYEADDAGIGHQVWASPCPRRRSYYRADGGVRISILARPYFLGV